jgi:hypothetical protein
MRLGTRIVRQSPYAFAGIKMEFGGDKHVSEAHGLGKAPFHFDGTEENSGRCQYCGKHLRYRCWIKSDDNRRFYVGRDCAEKWGESALIEPMLRFVSGRYAQEQNAAASAYLRRVNWNWPKGKDGWNCGGLL